MFILPKHTGLAPISPDQWHLVVGDTVAGQWQLKKEYEGNVEGHSIKENKIISTQAIIWKLTCGAGEKIRDPLRYLAGLQFVADGKGLMIVLPDDEIDLIKKRNRVKKLSPKTHKVAHESGRSTKSLWQRIITKSQKGK